MTTWRFILTVADNQQRPHSLSGHCEAADNAPMTDVTAAAMKPMSASETTTAAPPQSQIDRAIAESECSPCLSKRGVVIFRGETPVARGYNFKPRIDACEGTAECKATCRTSAVHAEQAALLRAGLHAQGSDLLHVKTVDGALVPSGGPSCVQCSKLIAVSGIVNVWLYEAAGWRCYHATEFHRLSLEHAAAALSTSDAKERVGIRPHRGP